MTAFERKSVVNIKCRWTEGIICTAYKLWLYLDQGLALPNLLAIKWLALAGSRPMIGSAASAELTLIKWLALAGSRPMIGSAELAFDRIIGLAFAGSQQMIGSAELTFDRTIAFCWISANDRLAGFLPNLLPIKWLPLIYFADGMRIFVFPKDQIIQLTATFSITQASWNHNKILLAQV